MSYNLKDVMYETDNHFVLRVKTGYEVYRNGITHATRCAQIGFKGEIGVSKAKYWCDKKEAEYSATNKKPPKA